MQEELTAAELLRIRRERAGLSQYQAQQKLGATRASLLSLIETGKLLPDPKLAKRIERMFNIPASSWNVNAEAA